MFGNVKANGIDLLGQLAINGYGSSQAASSPTLRWQWGNQQTDSIYKDFRFAGLLLGGAAMALSDDSPLGRLGFDLAAGSGNSLMATEMVRREAIKRTQVPQGAPGQNPQGAPAFGPPVQEAQNGYGAFQHTYMPGQFR